MAISILGEIETVDSGDACPATWDIVGKNGTTPMTVSVTPAGTGSVLLIIATAVVDASGTGDHAAAYRLKIGSTAQTPIICSLADQPATPEKSAMTIMWAETGLSGSQDISLEWQIDKGSPTIDTTRYRSLQVIEFTSGASILVELSKTGTDTTSSSSFVNVPGLASSSTAVTTGYTQLMLSNFQPGGGADESAGLTLAVGGTAEGPESASWTDTSTQKTGTSLAWFSSGNTGSVVFSLQWKDRQNGPKLHSSYPSTLQVIEFDSSIIALDKSVTSVAPDTAPASWADMTDMADSAFSVDGTSSVILMMSCGVPYTVASDEVADYRMADNDTLMGPTYIVFNDEVNGVPGWCVIWAKTGISGSHDLAFQWQDSEATPDVYTPRRSFQIAEFSISETITVDKWYIHRDNPIIPELDAVSYF